MEKSKLVPWYDGGWISAYHQALRILSPYPTELRAFKDQMEPLRTPVTYDVNVLRELLSEDNHTELKQILHRMKAEQFDNQEIFRFGRKIIQNHPEFTLWQQKFTDLVSEIVGEKVEPAYNFLSLYNNLGVCEPHIDAPVAKWTLDICLEQSGEWPISISQVVPWPDNETLGEQALDENWQRTIFDNPELKFTSYSLRERDAILFAGSSQWHFRNRIPNATAQNFCHLLFFHYIPEGAWSYILPGSWAEIFGVNELEILGQYYGA